MIGRKRARLVAGKPGLRLVAFEAVDAEIGRAAMGIPPRRIGERQHVGGMEADEGVEVVIVALGGMDGLRQAQLFRGLAEKDERAVEIEFLHGGLGGQHAAQRADAERRMRVRMASRVFAQSRPGHLAGGSGLAVTRHRIVLRIGADHRAFAAAIAGNKGGRHSAAARLDLESLGTQALHVPGGRFVLTQGRFGIMPDDLVPIR